jgi:hypothetical protein
LEIDFRFIKDGKIAHQINDTSGDSVQYYSSGRIVLIRMLSIENFEPGKYKLEVEVKDLIKGQSVLTSDLLEVKETKDKTVKRAAN